ATVGKTYQFSPKATDADKDKVTFTIANKPTWATFSAATGALAGTPAAKDAGSYAAIEIAATDGEAVTALTPFTITVAAGSASSGDVSLAWTPPTENADGSTLTDLSGYKIHYGNASKNYTQTVAVSNPGLTRFVLDSLPAGKNYIAMTAYNSAGAESDYSPEVSVTVN
ncbi:MAG TPA: putative Ig domain-containing protein, partial [Steroidobacteraceae bacterium]|nr:putative Ig domain-containing protein [Steroidobacteraceae bacterium]